MPARLLIAAACVLTLTGCGSREPSDAEQVRTLLADFATATREKDYGTLCDEIFSPSLLKGVQGIGLPCEVAMRNSLGEVENPRLTVGNVQVDDGKARAEVRTSADNQEPSRDTLEMVRLKGGWRVSSLSAAPQETESPVASPAAP